MKTRLLNNYDSPLVAKPLLADSAKKWWATLSFEEKFYVTIRWLKNEKRNVPERHPDNLSEEEIQAVYKPIYDLYFS